MQNHRFLKSLITVGVLAIAGASQALVIATWTYELSVPTGPGPYNPEVGAGSSIGNHVSSATVYSNPSGNGSFESYSANNWAVGDYWEFKVSTTGLQGVTFSFDQTGSSSGPRDFQVQWSTNGVTFNNFGSVYAVLLNGGAPNATWTNAINVPAYSFSNNMSAVTALDNQSTIWLRLTHASAVSISGGTIGTSGTNRIDNVTISASPVPEPASLAVIGLGVTALLKRRRK